MKRLSEELWRKFEELIYNIICEVLNLNDSNTIMKLTEKTKDGGYDGVFILPLIEDKQKGLIEYKILFEAKLRENIKSDLPLNDFSKALIIAINTSADSLIIATNIHLSNLTIAQLEKYSEKTRLSIKVMNGNYINHWLSDFDNDAKISKELKSLIKSYNKENMPYSLMNISDILDLAKQKEKKYNILGTNRKNHFYEIINKLSSEDKTILIEGEMGVGKTFFINVLKNGLSDLIDFFEIDLKRLFTPRVLFLEIIHKIWNLPCELINEVDNPSFIEAISILGDAKIDRITSLTVLEAFGRNKEEYNNDSDIYNYYLIKYLTEVFKIQKRRKRYAIILNNLNCTTQDLLVFLHQFIANLSNSITIIIERDTFPSINLNNNDYQKMNIINLNNLIQHDNIYRLTNLNDIETYDLIDNIYQYNVLEQNVKEYIFSITNGNPLFIETLINYLNLTELLRKIPSALQLQTFKRVHFDNELDVLCLLIESICKMNTFYSSFFAIMSIFDGIIRESILIKILQNYQEDKLDILITANIVYIEDEFILIKNKFYLDNLDHVNRIGYSQLKSLASKIYDLKDNLLISNEKQEIICFKLLSIMNKYSEASCLGFEISKKLYKKGQYFLCYDYAKKALNQLKKLNDFSINIKVLQIYILEELVQVSFYLKDDVSETLPIHIKELKALINLNQYDLSSHCDYYDLMINFYLIICRYEHSKGNFLEQLNYMETALNFIDDNFNYCPEFLVTNVWVEYSISLKELEGIKGQIEFLSEKTLLYPNAWDLAYTYNTALYEKFNDTLPEKSIKYLHLNKELGDEVTVPEIYHNDVHIANNLLYLRDYKNGLNYSLKLIDETNKLGLKNEVGRLANLIACFYIVANNFKEAKNYFIYGSEIYKDSQYYSYLWPLKYNFATLYFHKKEYDDFLVQAKICVNLLKKYKSKVNALDLDYIKYPKIYVAHLKLIQYLKVLMKNNKYKDEAKIILDDLILDINLPEIKNYVSGISRFPRGLRKTSYFHNNFILIGY